jgi:general secretion pathway protein G
MGKKRTGFTIVELLVVIVVIGVLSVIVVVSYIGIRDRAMTSLFVSNLNSISKYLFMYQLENGVYPSDIAGLNDLVGSKLSSVLLLKNIFRNQRVFV